jgi:REP element-mobilizing transposase RayT
MANTYTNLLFHVVFSTKNRLPLLTRDVREMIYPYIGGVIRGERCVLLEIGGTTDHVHLLLRMRADLPLSDAVKRIKGNSSRWLNQNPDYATRFGWQSGYGAFSVSESQVPAVRRYIQTQEQHHSKVAFRDEFIALLKRHQVDYDERYLPC